MLATVADFLDRYPSLTDPDADLEDKIERLLAMAAALMAAFCGWPALDTGVYTMEAGTVTLYPKPAMGRPRALDHGLRWVTSVTNAYIDEDWAYSSAVSAGDLQQDNRLGVLWLKPSSDEEWSYADRGNKVVLVHGFVATPSGGYSTAPPDIVAICVMVARHLYDQGQSQGLQSYSVGDRSATLADDVGLLLPKAAQMALEPYKIDPPYPQRELSHGC